jgi:putative chitinase
MLTKEQLAKVYKNRSLAALDQYMVKLNSAMVEFEINTPLRVAAFLAQLGHESGELRWFEEFASGMAYEGRADLGNTSPGDGQRYKGRGPIQLTGKANYIKAGKALGLDLVNNPHLAATIGIGFRIAGWFWKTKGLNELADKKDFDLITKRINGGFNGKQHRDALYQLAQQALVVEERKPEVKQPSEPVPTPEE